MDNIDSLLYELKRILGVIDDKYVSKIEFLLNNDSEYDRLFYHYADKFGIDKKNSKQLCINRVNSIGKSVNDYYMIKDMDNDITITDLYKIIDDNISQYYDDIDTLEELIINKENIIYGINSMYWINKKEEINYIKLYLSHVFYSYMLSYIDIVDVDDYYIDEDTRYINVYNLLNLIEDTKEVINIFDNYTEEVIDIYNLYLDLDKHGKNLIHLNVLNSDKFIYSIKICPFSIMMYKEYYNMYYKNEKLKSVEIGNITLTILNDMIKDSYDNNCNKDDVYKKTIRIIKGSNKEYDIFEWFNYLVANVYENILNKSNTDIDENMFIQYVKDGIDGIINNEYLLQYVLAKFYEFNKELYDIKSLKKLRNSINDKDKALIRKINPYYSDIK